MEIEASLSLPLDCAFDMKSPLFAKQGIRTEERSLLDTTTGKLRLIYPFLDNLDIVSTFGPQFDHLWMMHYTLFERKAQS